MNRYQKLLRDPRWQRKRLEIMQRDNWACVHCGDSTSELNVHHNRYITGHLPWEYADEHLTTLCKFCHENHHSSSSAQSVPLVSFLDRRSDPIKGVAINWTDESEDGFCLFDFIPWTGRKLREGDKDRDEIFVCVDKRGREFLIDASCARAFLFPKNIEVDQLTFRQHTTGLAPFEMAAWLGAVRDLVRNGERDFD